LRNDKTHGAGRHRHSCGYCVRRPCLSSQRSNDDHKTPSPAERGQGGDEGW
jgi:hypothetical protein